MDMIEAIVRSGLKESALTPARGLTELARAGVSRDSAARLIQVLGGLNVPVTIST